MLAGVAVLVALLLTGASTLSNDWLAVAGCFAGLGAGAAILDAMGRRRAVQHPHPLLQTARLPSAKTRLKPAIIGATLLALVLYVTANARPGEHASPLPYFLAAEFLYLVMPQLLARRLLRSGAPADAEPEAERAARRPRRK